MPGVGDTVVSFSRAYVILRKGESKCVSGDRCSAGIEREREKRKRKEERKKEKEKSKQGQGLGNAEVLF